MVDNIMRIVHEYEQRLWEDGGPNRKFFFYLFDKGMAMKFLMNVGLLRIKAL
jgi:hypothetical protein